MTRPNEASQPSEQRQHQPKHESVFISRRVPVMLRCPHAQHFGDVQRRKRITVRNPLLTTDHRVPAATVYSVVSSEFVGTNRDPPVHSRWVQLGNFVSP